jgi:hypothetical protein
MKIGAEMREIVELEAISETRGFIRQNMSLGYLKAITPYSIFCAKSQPCIH